MKITDRVLNKIALPLITVAGLLMILAFVVSAKEKNTENNAYIRVINCIVSYPATSRTQQNIEQCYQIVEHQLNIKLQRYDSSTN